nr:hypothetical protein [Tanacetum cinerariifolium]
MKDVPIIHYNINSFTQRQSGAFPGDLSLGIVFPGDLSLGKRHWERLVRDSFPNDNSWQKGGSHDIFSEMGWAGAEAGAWAGAEAVNKAYVISRN